MTRADTKLAETIAFMRAAHTGQLDKLGAPYWKHPMRVMAHLSDLAPLEAKLVALLHDVIEDTIVTPADLCAAGYSSAVVDAVVELTRKPGEPYDAYIERLAASGNELAIQVKLADLADNLDPARPRPASVTKRYLKARDVLKERDR
jgi:(p)ppGpp synthase/HD superfamily hydrolase